MDRKLLYCVIALFIMLPASGQTGREIMEKVIDNQKADSSAMDMRMNLTDSRGNTGVRRIQTLTMDDNGRIKSISLFLEPASVRNTRFLTIENDGRDDDQWIYLPSLRKVKRIAAGERDGSFMGSDFYYSDMGSRELDDSTYRILGEESISGRGCWIVESVPKPGTDSSYGKIVSWVDGETWLTMKVDFYDDDGETKVKELTLEGVKEIDGHWIADRTTMKTLDTGHMTVLELRQVKYDIPVNPGYFTTSFLRTGRP